MRTVMMELQQTTKRVRTSGGLSQRVLGKGFVLFGRDQNDKFFERRFPTEYSAEVYAMKQGWEVKKVPVHQLTSRSL